jgi:uncharacterized membrane protein YuzA (DUF378 family)
VASIVFVLSFICCLNWILYGLYELLQMSGITPKLISFATRLETSTPRK